MAYTPTPINTAGRTLIQSARYLIPVLSLLALATACTPKPWPASPLYKPPENDPSWESPASREEAIEALQGHYAHYSIVAYITQTPAGPMRTFIITYGFTDFIREGDDLVEQDRFCRAEYIANQPFTTQFDDAATQAIQPRTAVVDVYREGDEWKVYRPATPTLIGIAGDPEQPLTTDQNDPGIQDDDGDGKPGVTVYLMIYGFIEAEIYIARREIFQNYFSLYSDGSLRGTVVDTSEQLVIDATRAYLNQSNNPPQYDDPGLNPILLIPVADDFDSCEELMAARDDLFPPEPIF